MTIPLWMQKRGIQPSSTAVGGVQGGTRRPLADGPGTELLALIHGLTDGKIPPCQECTNLARSMNAWGVAGCRERIAEIVEDIKPRADAWFAADADAGSWTAALKANAPDFAKRAVIRRYVNRAIAAAEKKKTPRRSNGRLPQRVRLPRLLRGPHDVTIVMGSFLRPEHLWRVLMSCRRELPGVPVIVADCSVRDGQEMQPALQRCRDLPGVTWLQMPFDAGVSACRNAAVEAAQTELVLLTDDDHEFCWASNLQGLCEVLHESGADIAAGCLQNGSVVQSWSYLVDGVPPNHGIRPSPDEWHQTSGGHSWRQSSTFFNLFLARRQTLLDVPWDDRFKIMEHRDHLCTVMEHGLQVVCSPAMIALHDRDSDPEPQYSQFRRRKQEMDRRLIDKRGFIVSFGTQTNEPIPSVRTVDESGPPNVLLFGVGHSGTSIVTRQLIEFGLQPGDADEQYCESVSIREANTRLLRRGRLPEDAAERLQRLPSPWILKDPRFVNTLETWLPLLQRHDPLLLYLTRDRDATERSYQRRGETIHRQGLTLDETIALAERQYELWPWRKLRVSIEQWASVCAMLDPERLHR